MISFKPILFVLFVFNGFYAFAQEIAIDTTALPYLQKAEFNVLGVGVNYEIPISKVLSLDSGLGFSSGVHVSGERIRYKYNLLNPGFYLKSELKYYYNRYVRVAKKLRTTNGEGSYFGFQNKLVTQRLFDSKSRLGNVMMYEVHWGIQRNVYNDFLFNFHIGLGRSHDFTSREGANYPSLGFKVSYLIATKKITRSSFDKFW
ncbi:MULTISPECIES: hypothetical protein [unclassified Flavobacterium]|uniref:hypothetical protein n=1 Tax=unclassified Flavobacterium TaxID=196869 RepID=UPI001291B820|nr:MULTISPECIES: hypothetical protein [unclassified Flavobacterium]MQP52085.1 hypothetical protein [Flavobacterium sp. LMO9]MQP61954.1 hypothetical protein [Flavobacterium sp. LMO6]